ncbi:MAG: hypothetical protein ACOC7P_00725 [Chloroflexota bacterium]
MPNLFWRKSTGEVLNVIESPFKTEEQLESYLWKTRELLSDLFIIKRQVRTARHEDIPDLIAFDKEGSVVIIELKNGPVAEDVISQVLRYAIWAETNPDSIRAMWLELDAKPEDINPPWENLSVKVVIIAPRVSSRVLRLANKINYPVQFLEIKRFSVDKEEFVLTDQLEPEPELRTGITKGQEVYDMDFYLENYNKASVPKFFDMISTIDSVVQEKGWELEKKMNKGYVSYKYGFPIVFGATWIGSKSFGIFFKVPKEKAESIVIPDITPHRYEEDWKQVLYKVEDPQNDVRKLLPVFEAAVRHITGIER